MQESPIYSERSTIEIAQGENINGVWLRLTSGELLLCSRLEHINDEFVRLEGLDTELSRGLPHDLRIEDFDIRRDSIIWIAIDDEGGDYSFSKLEAQV